MSSEDVRIARTEALFRRVNERIAQSADRFGADEASFVCECDDSSCVHRIRASMADYEVARADGARFMVVDGHVNPDVEQVIDRRRRFWLVEKVKPLVRRTAQQLDPRAAET